MTEDGLLVVSCWAHYFKKVNNVLRYEDTLSRWRGNIAGNKLLREHLADALKNNRSVRLVIARTEETAAVNSGEAATKVKKEFYTRPEMIGRVTHFDGDRYIIEFLRSTV